MRTLRTMVTWTPGDKRSPGHWTGQVSLMDGGPCGFRDFATQAEAWEWVKTAGDELAAMLEAP